MLLSVKTRLESRLTQKEAVLDALYAEEANYEPVKSFELDTGEASHRVTRRGLSEIRTEITRLELEIDQIYRRLNGFNVVRFVADRRG